MVLAGHGLTEDTAAIDGVAEARDPVLSAMDQLLAELSDLAGALFVECSCIALRSLLREDARV